MSTSLSSSPSSPPRLDHSTLNLLDDFISQRSERQAKLHRIQMEAARHGVGEIKLSDQDESEQSSLQISDHRSGNQSADLRNSDSGNQQDDDSSDDSGEEDDDDEDEEDDDCFEDQERREKKEQEDREEEDRLLEAEALADLERLVQLEYEEALNSADGNEVARVTTPPPLTRIMPVPSIKSKSKSKSHSKNRPGKENEDEVGERKGMLTVDEFREIFTEDYQVSQFWYSTPFSHKVSKLIKSLPFIDSNSIILYISSPTLYVSHVSLFGQSDNVFLFEYDQRFASVAERKDGTGTQFFKYDLNRPEKVLESLRGKVDLIIIDPPFLNEVTNELMGKSVKMLLKSSSTSSNGGKVLLLTGLSIGDKALKFYQDENVPSSLMKRTKLEVEHASGLSNPFGAWANFDNAENWGE